MKFSSLLAIVGLTLISILSLPAQTVRVIFSSGEASMQRPDESALRPVIKGETVIIGTRIVTGADGRVVLTPMPGVKSIIAPNSILLLESSSETRTSPTEVTHQAVLDLKEGAIVTDLQKPEGVAYDYSIRTARGLAGARGTTFTVGINKAGIQTIVVAHGTITLNFVDGSSATLKPGDLSITKTTGGTQSVKNVSELPEGDQEVAQNWAEITILEIAAAVEAGLEVSPEALKNALDTATTLGITLSPETQATVDKALTTLESASLFEKEETADPLKKVEETTTTDTAQVTTQILSGGDLALFRSQLTAEQLAVFDSLPADIQQQFLALNDPAIASIALSPDRDTGLPLTHNDLRVHLEAFIALSDESLAFVKALAGSSLQNFDNTPDPAAFSPEAFERTLTSWNLLSSTQRSQIIALGAGESIMDTSAGYIAALLDSLSSTQASLIQQTGWGDHLTDLAGKPTSQNYFSALSGISVDGLAAIKFFDISPDVAISYYINFSDLAETLGGLSTANQETLRQLGIVDAILNSSYNSASAELPPAEAPFGDYANRIANALAFYGQLTSNEKTAARAIGLGELFYNYAPGQSVSEGGTTALQRARQLAKFYNDNPDLRQAIQETGLLAEHAFLYGSFQPVEATAALQTYNALPARTRNYLLTSDTSFSFFSIYQASQSGNEFNYGIVFRSLSQINGILAGLNAAEYGMLLDLDLSTAVFAAGDNYSESFRPYFQGAPLTVIKATLAHYAQLGTLHKFVLRELGIVGKGNVAILGTDTEGLGLLLSAYGTLPGTLRAATEQLNEYNHHEYSTPTYYGSSSGPIMDRSYFFPRGYEENTVMHRVKFSSTRDLYVGATRYLRINGSYFGGQVPIFDVGAGRDLYLHASNLIDLYSTGFSSNIRGITMAAHTINLDNVHFPEGSRVSLNSKTGQVAFFTYFDNMPLANGKVNFRDVTYGGNSINSASDLTSEFGANGNIRIGTLKNPAPRPTYTPTSNPQ